MSSIIREKWVWIIIGASIALGVVPLLVILLLFEVPGFLGAFLVWAIIFSWGIAAGYKDWVVDRRKRERLARSLAA
jgi:hypothetical protein